MKASETGEAVYRGTHDSCVRNGLALEASGIEYGLRQDADGWAIFVAGEDASQAREELEAYRAEHAFRQIAPASGGSGWAGVAGYVTILLGITLLQRYQAFGFDWLESGRMQAGSVRHGELWRTVTALTLHVDPDHLLANVVIGGVFGLFAGQLLGSGLAWFSILLAGCLGNLLAAMFRPAGHASIGASTAVFATLGILAGRAWFLRRRARESKLARYGPIIGAIVLLSYLGAGGERTDVLAHAAGFFCGVFLGALLGLQGDRLSFGRKGQIASGIAAGAMLATAWFLALVRTA